MCSLGVLQLTSILWMMQARHDPGELRTAAVRVLLLVPQLIEQRGHVDQL